MNLISKTFFTLLLFAFSLPIVMTGQSQNCIDFEDLELGAEYGGSNGQEPGDEIFIEEEVPVSLEAFQYFNGNTEFGNVWVTNEIFGDNFETEGQYLFVSNVNLYFDFSTLSQPITSLCFQFLDGGGQENISVNGEPILSLEAFSDAPTEIAPGVILEIITDSNTNLEGGTLCLSGNIESLLIGGQELAVDAFCFEETPPSPCSMVAVEAEITDCEEAGTYDIEVGLSFANDINFSVELFLDGQSQGDFVLTDFPVSLEQIIPADDAEYIDIVVCETEFPDQCCVETSVAIASCTPQTCMEFENLEGSVYAGRPATNRARSFTQRMRSR